MFRGFFWVYWEFLEWLRYSGFLLGLLGIFGIKKKFCGLFWGWYRNLRGLKD